MSEDHGEPSPGAAQVVAELISAFATHRDEFFTRARGLAQPADIALAAHDAASEALDGGQFERAEGALSIEAAACLDVGDLVRHRRGTGQGRSGSEDVAHRGARGQEFLQRHEELAVVRVRCRARDDIF